MNNGNINKKQLEKQFEQQFKNKFENAQFAPPAHLWEQIDAALDEKPWYKRPLFYWTSGLVAALLMVVMFWFTLVYDNSNSPSTIIAESDKNKIENTENNNDLGLSKNTNSSVSESQQPTNNNTESSDNTVNSFVEENKLVANSDTKTIDSGKKVNSIDNSTTNQDTNLNNDSDVAISIIIKDKDKDNKTNSTSDKIISAENTALTVIDFKELDWSKYLPVGNPYFEQEISIKLDSTNEALANNQNSKNPTEDTQKSFGIAITFGINHTQGIYKPSFRTDSIYTGLTVIEAETSNFADTLTQMNISGTYQQTGFDIALAFGKNKRWSLNTGLGIGKANYSFGSSNSIRIPDIAGNNLQEFPNNQVEVNYEWTQIPIAIGYQFGESRAKKFSGFAQLGTAIELLSSYSYTSADPNFTYAIGTHRTTNTQVWTQVGINYHITNRLMLWGGGTYKSSLSSLINENGVTFSSQSYGWQVGTRFTIFNSGK